MTNSDTVSNVLGTIGTVLWCIQLSPQIYFLWKHKDATGFPPIFMFLWALSGVPFSIYFVTTNSYIPLQVQPQMFTLLCSIAWIQAMYYPPYQYPKKRIMIYAGSFFICALALELGFGIWLKQVYLSGKHWPSLIFGIIASVVLALGLIPPYIELWKRKGRVVGINFLFLMLDTAGAVFSMASTLVGDIDIMGMILYAIIIAMECGIYVSQIIWYVRFRVIRKETDDDEEKQNGEGEDDKQVNDDENSDSSLKSKTPEATAESLREKEVISSLDNSHK